MSHYDVVVVGGRVAGASTAMLLARAGARVAVVDRSAYGSDTPSTHALMRAGVLQLSRWGLLPAVVAAGTPAVRRTTFHYADGRTVPVTIRPSAGVDALYAPRRALLDRVLVDAAADAGAHVLHRVTVLDLLRDRHGRVGGVVTQGPSGRLVLPAALTVGADGLRSTVAARAGAAVLRRGVRGGATLYRYVEGVAADGYEWAYGDRAAAGVIPTGDGLACVFVSTTAERLRGLRRAGSEAAFTTLLRRVAPGLAENVLAGRPHGRLHGWRGEPGFLRRSWGPGWALVGDAGYFKDAITAHGITDALRDAELLASSLLDVLGGGSARAAGAAYEGTRLALSAQLFAATEAIAGYDWDQPRIEALLRWVSSAMSDEVNHLAGLDGLPHRSTPPTPVGVLAP
ncbi:NAD(P)/FAD-dependent oxidoreductase [Nocardioides caldifontis]|uniref:NAD(P)/FAD-dependent oxidoreductase n=1 Tax=Nocardioides caldifontis TaxID=2588938 RepID=UPI00193A3C9E|nr:FAD-dependent monooxygenase [Nocardioides caldifontis]